MKIDWAQITMLGFAVFGAILIGAWANSPNLGLGIALIVIAIMPYRPK